MVIEEQDNSWAKIVKTYQRCPHCKTGLLNTRVKRGFFVRNLFVWMNVKRYECSSCGRKSYIKAESLFKV